MYEKKIVELIKHVEYEESRFADLEGQLMQMRQHLSDSKRSVQVKQNTVDKLNLKLHSMLKLNEEAMSKIQSLEVANSELLSTKELLNEQLKTLQQNCYVKQRKGLEDEIVKLKNLVSDKHAEIEDKNLLKDEGSLVKSVSGLGGQINMQKSGKLRETLSIQRATIAKIFEEVCWLCYDLKIWMCKSMLQRLLPILPLMTQTRKRLLRKEG